MSSIDAAIIKALVEHIGGDSDSIPDGTIGGGGVTYTAGDGIDITDNAISVKYNDYDFTLSAGKLRLNYHQYNLATASAEDAKYWTRNYQGTKGYYLGLNFGDIQHGYLKLKDSNGSSHRFYSIKQDSNGVLLWEPVTKNVIYLKVDDKAATIQIPQDVLSLYQEPTDKNAGYGWFLSKDKLRSDNHERYIEYYNLLTIMGVEFNTIGA